MGKNKPSNQHPRLFSVLSVARLVLELAPFHHGNADEQEERCHGHWTEDEPIYSMQRGIHYPYAPPHRDFAEIVGMAAVFP